ncbi:MAG: DUF3850 domain-containing protein [Clostridium sp.]|nr:DUF3850 domain-containing protein [Clostridium sp.]
MEEYTQITLSEWMQWKEDIRKKLQETAENFVYIGYRLRQIRDTEAYKMAGADSIFSFAQQEYGLTRTVVQRFMAISEKFGAENGVELKSEYKGLGSSKLQEMLTMSDDDCQLITEHTTVKQIRELKQFINEPEAAEEPENTQGERDWTPLQKCIIDYFSVRKEMLNDAVELLKREKTEESIKQLVEIINPSGAGSHKKGIVFLFFYDYSTGVKYKLIGQDNQAMSWADFLTVMADIYRDHVEGEKDVWTCFYEPEEKAGEVGDLCGVEACATSHKMEEKAHENEADSEPETTEKDAENPAEEEPEEAAGVPDEINPYERQPSSGRESDSVTWKEPEKKERKPIELPPADAEYTVPIGKTFFGDVVRGGQRFLILKETNPYRVGNVLHLQERDSGDETGNIQSIKVTHLMKDHGGITPGYCVIQFELLPPAEEQLPGQMSIEDMGDEQENQDEA